MWRKTQKTFLLQIDTVLLKLNRGTLSVDRNYLAFNFYVFFYLKPYKSRIKFKNKIMSNIHKY